MVLPTTCCSSALVCLETQWTSRCVACAALSEGEFPLETNFQLTYAKDNIASVGSCEKLLTLFIHIKLCWIYRTTES